MKKILSLVFLWCIAAYAYAQTNVPTADLLDIKFSVHNGVEDISTNPFTVDKGKGVTTPIYDQSIRQYVSHYTINTSTTSTNYYKISYKGNEDFKEKLKKSFTIEVYIKTTGNRDVVPVGSMYSGGFGIQQVAKGGAMQLKLGHTPKDYAYIGSKTVYQEIPEYYHIVYTYDGNMLKSYYNGVLTDNVAGGALRFASSSTHHWIGIGGDVSSSTSSVEKAFNGDIALVRMYSKALNNEEVLALNKQIEDRKSLAEIDVLNNLVESKLARYMANETNSEKKAQAQQFMTEGRKLMQQMNTTAQDIYAFCSRVESNLGIAAAQANPYPRFAVMSDLHIGASYSWNDKITKAINIIDTQNEPLDAVFVVGDITNGGTSAQYSSARKVFSQMPASTPVYYCMGNHDWLASSTACNNYFKNNLGQDQNQYFEIKGHPFVLISMDSYNQTSGYKTATQNYLKNVLADANMNYPGKPIFLFIHIPELNTVYGSQNRGITLIKDILKNYPQVVMFSGHSHFSLYDERSILQDRYTMIHDGGFAFTRVETGKTGKIEPASSKDFSEGCMVSVEANGDVNVKRMDFFRNREIRRPWIVKAPHDGSNFTYTSARNGGNKPVFPTTEKPEVKVLKSSAVNVTFPQATDDELVHHYEVILTSLKNDSLKSTIVFPSFHLGNNQPLSFSSDISPLYTYKGYHARIVAVDSYGQRSDPFDSDLFITPKGYASIDNIYLTGTVIAGGWTVSKSERLAPVLENPGVFEWQGQLKVGEFKFLLQNTTTPPALNATATRSVAVGTPYDVIITDGSSSKYKFKITKKGEYKITVDTNNWTVTVADPSKPSLLVDEELNDSFVGMDVVDNPDDYFTVISKREGVDIIVKTNNAIVNSVELFDISGKVVDQVQGENTNYSLGKNLASGVYILKINCANITTYSKKVLVK